MGRVLDLAEPEMIWTARGNLNFKLCSALPRPVGFRLAICLISEKKMGLEAMEQHKGESGK